MGILTPFEALRIARERGLDLVEVSPNAVPPVCRIQDYGRFLYEKEKSDRAARKKQKVIVIKEVKFSVTVDEHDYQTKKNQAVRFLTEGDKVKAKVFAEVDEIVTDPDAVLASNTSSIPIMKIAAATKNPQRVLGLHFFNPVPVLPLVELISTLVTSDDALKRTEEFAGKVLGKQVVRCSDRSGFVVNALLVPYLLAAIRMVEAGFATIEDVDKAVVAGLSHPMGPLRLSDLVGLDTLKLIADKMYEEFKEPLYGPPPLLLRMVEAGQLGKKSGQGFYTY